jgi:hypothetical protein
MGINIPSMQRQQAQAPRMGLFATQAQIDANTPKQPTAGVSRFPGFGFHPLNAMGGGSAYSMSNLMNPSLFSQQPQENQLNRLNLGKQKSIRFAAGGLAELSNGSTGQSQQPMQPMQGQQQQPVQPNNLYGTPDQQMPNQMNGGLGMLNNMNNTGINSFAGGGYLKGDGDGMSDDIPATIDGQEPARLATEEFVVPADVVSHIGNGSSEAGAKRLYAMLDRIREARTGNPKQGKQINPDKYLPA